MTTPIGEAWADVLPVSHREALHTAMTTIYDVTLEEYRAEIEFYDTLLGLELPPRYRPRYDWVFGKRFLATMLVVGWKLAQPRAPAPLLSCRGEELALHALIEIAADDLGESSIEANFGDFEDVAFQDVDFMYLYDPASDGIEDSEVGRELGIDLLRFDEWFIPFDNATTTPQPY